MLNQQVYNNKGLKNLQRIKLPELTKEQLKRRTTRKEQIVIFLDLSVKEKVFSVLNNIRDFLKDLGLRDGNSKYVENLLSELELDKKIERIGCSKCYYNNKERCFLCPYNRYKEFLKLNNTRNRSKAAKSVIILTEIGKQQLNEISKSLKLCYDLLDNR